MRQRLLAPFFVGLLAATGCTNTPPTASGNAHRPVPVSPPSSAQPTPPPKSAEPGPKTEPAKKADAPKAAEPERKKNEFKTGEREIG
jgi:hypothetical protein